MRVLGAVLLLAACSGAQSASSVPTPERDPPGTPASGYVLVSQGAWFRAASDDAAPGARAVVLTGDRCDAPNLDVAWVMRRVAEHGDWLIVENLQAVEAAAHCYEHTEALEGWRLRLHVRRTDALQVTTREVDVDFDDGTGFTLSAGVAVSPEGDGFQVAVDDNLVVLPVPAAAVGAAYAAPTRHLLPDDYEHDDDDGVLPGSAAFLDGQRVEVRHLRPRAIEQVDRLVTMTNRCSQYFVQVRDEDGGIGWGTIGCGRYGELGDPRLARLAAGAHLTWPDGTSAGETLEEQAIRWPADTRGDRRCFRLPLRPHADWPDRDHPDDEWFLTLCAPDDDWIDSSRR